MNILKKLVNSEYRELCKFEKIADKIMELDESYQKLTDEELKAKTLEFKEQLKDGATLDDILVPAFATVREAAYRMIGEKAYYVQLLGGIAIHYGNIAELKTGEGKTLVTTFPAYLNALSGNGVHVITVNEYLTQRNAEWMGKIYNFLGLTVGVNYRDLTPKEKREAYECDITYTTNNELGFDYLRDNMVVRKEDRVLRGLNYGIIDEVDSVLIDEARTPLIISGGRVQSANIYIDADRAVKNFKENEDFTMDLKTKSISLTDEGAAKIEKTFKLTNLYDLNNTVLVHHISQALKANFVMKRDVDYVVNEERQVIIVDPFTGRLMPGRQYNEGLHQAIEAKEGVEINSETQTMATITFQNLFRMYNKLSGMTGTAKTEEEEFRNIYNMFVICIPTNKPVIREDYPDLLYATELGKFKAIVKCIKEKHDQGIPVLVGTISVENNERLSAMLKKAGIPHEVLNAKNHAREAEIIAKAGKKGAVTIATNMAGRGTDIKIDDEVKALGGLCVFGTERHESRRIDNQLRGRSGRQGDPGMSQFFVSFEDDLMRRFGTEKIKGMLQNLGLEEDAAIRSKMFTRSIEQAQKKVEGNNFDNRKNILEYDDVMSEQRNIIYERRNEILDDESIHDRIIDILRNFVDNIIESHLNPEKHENKLTDKDIAEIIEFFDTNFNDFKLPKKVFESDNVEDIKQNIYEILEQYYLKKTEDMIGEERNEFEKAVSLRMIDSAWVEHLSVMDHLREGIGLRGYGQNNPLQAYALEGFELFEKMQDSIDYNIVMFLLKIKINQKIERTQTLKGEAHDNSEKGTRKPKVVKKIGRNDPCPCGSGKKYKQCCGK